MYTVKIDNAYSDEHESTHEVLVAPPAHGQDLDDWWEEVVWPHTGDGHGAANPDLGVCYTAEIIAADGPEYLGLTYEWVA